MNHFNKQYQSTNRIVNLINILLRPCIFVCGVDKQMIERNYVSRWSKFIRRLFYFIKIVKNAFKYEETTFEIFSLYCVAQIVRQVYYQIQVTISFKPFRCEVTNSCAQFVCGVKKASIRLHTYETYDMLSYVLILPQYNLTNLRRIIAYLNYTNKIIQLIYTNKNIIKVEQYRKKFNNFFIV